MLKKLEYAFKTGEALSKERLNNRVLDIDMRLHALELIQINWDEAINQVQNMGLDRINIVILPLIDEIKGLLEDIKVERENELADIQKNIAELLNKYEADRSKSLAEQQKALADIQKALSDMQASNKAFLEQLKLDRDQALMPPNIDYVYNASNQLIKQTNTYANGNEVIDYTYNTAGQLITLVATNAYKRGTSSFTYNAQGAVLTQKYTEVKL